MGRVFLFLARIRRVSWLKIIKVLYMIGNKGRETTHQQVPVPYGSAPAKNGEAAVEHLVKQAAGSGAVIKVDDWVGDTL